jgi:hypothetical protein
MFVAQLVGQLLGAILAPVAFMLFSGTGQVRRDSLCLVCLVVSSGYALVLRPLGKHMPKLLLLIPAGECAQRPLPSAILHHLQMFGTAGSLRTIWNPAFTLSCLAGECAEWPLPSPLLYYLPRHGFHRNRGLQRTAQALRHTHARLLRWR